MTKRLSDTEKARRKSLRQLRRPVRAPKRPLSGAEKERRKAARRLAITVEQLQSADMGQRYRDYVNAQMNRDYLRGLLLEANILLDKARHALDDPSAEPVEVRRVDEAEEPWIRLQAASLRDRVAELTKKVLYPTPRRPFPRRRSPRWLRRLRCWLKGEDFYDLDP